MEANLVIIAVEHQELRHSLRRVLSDRIERMLFADDAQSLLDTLALTRADLVLVDLSLPASGNANILKVLGTQPIEPPLIILGDYEPEEAEEDALSHGARAYVMKNRLVSDLMPAVEGVFQQDSQNRKPSN